MSVKESLQSRLVREGKGWWRYASNQLALLMGVAAGFIVENPTIALGYVEQIPQPWRSLLTFAVTAGIPILVRMARQPKLQAKVCPEETP